jgi:hypothetical protein
MKLIKTILAALLLVPTVAVAQPYTAGVEQQRLINLGMTSELAVELTNYINGDGLISLLLPNDTYLKARNAAGTADINVLKVDGNDETILNADSGDAVSIAVNGTGVLSVAAALVSSTMDLAFATNKTVALQEATAASACMGTLTANGGTPVVVSTTCALTGSRIFLTRTSAETGSVSAWISALSTGVSFSITSEAADTGTYNWIIFHEAA